jgi:uncharacterized protein YndB with AHSA1/START domain
MSSCKQQVLIEAPVEQVWELLEDPAKYPEWSGDTVEATGVPTKVEVGSTFDLKSVGPMKLTATTTFEVDKFEDLREIKLHCQATGYYSHWLLTEAQGNTFADVELGIEPVPGLEARVIGAMHTKGYLRRALARTLDDLRGAVSRAPSAP